MVKIFVLSNVYSKCFSTVKCHSVTINYQSITVKNYFTFLLSVYIQTHISIPNIQNGQLKTTISNKNSQNG